MKLNHKIHLEYVASGCNYTRLPTPGAYENQDNLNAIWSIFDTLNNIDGKTYHKFSLLYNAYTETHFGPAFKKYYRDHIHSIHSDSGGLQMVTMGKTPTPQLKQAVYESQANSSDIAMSFDEIPVHIAGSRSLRLDMKGRFFDETKLKTAAEETGKNLATQLAYFSSVDSKAKPLLIIQGNCLETYQQWTEIVMRQIPRELQAGIGGVAMGGAALGNAFLEDIKKAFYFSQLPVDHSHLHLLGVGSLLRLLPAIVFGQTGVYDPSLWISYDSSTHSAGPEMGRYYINEKTIAFGKNLNSTYTMMRDDIEKNFPGVIDYDVVTLHDALTCGGYVKAQAKYGTTKEAVQTFVVMFASSVANFMRHVNGAVEDKHNVLRVVKGVERNAINSLYDVKTVDDFKHWETHVGKYLQSNPVRPKPTHTIDGLFD